jgi:hypothetical protein
MTAEISSKPTQRARIFPARQPALHRFQRMAPVSAGLPMIAIVQQNDIATPHAAQVLSVFARRSVTIPPS